MCERDATPDLHAACESVIAIARRLDADAMRWLDWTLPAMRGATSKRCLACFKGDWTTIEQGPVAQGLERPAHNRLVAGPNPAGPIIEIG